MRTASSHWQSFARICQNGLAAVCSDFNTANVNVNGTSASDAYGGSTTGAWIVRESIASVPEPGSLALLGMGLVAFGLFQKKRTS
jgi:hypothetical protein